MRKYGHTKMLARVLVLAVPVVAGTAGCGTGEQNGGRDVLSTEEISAKVDEHLERAVESGFSGAVLIARNGEVLLQKGYGFADPERRVAFRAETPSYIGSIVKQFTAAAILKLEEEGRLSVTDSLARFFPDVPADKRGITVHQILTHTAALPEYGSGPDEEPAARDEVVRWILHSQLAARPGERFAYSNAGYTLLAALIEVVAGMPHEAYLRERLFLPAETTQTGSVPVQWASETAVGQRRGNATGTQLRDRWMVDGPSWNVRGAGGFVSTVGDLHRWAEALASHRVLSARAREKMIRGYFPLDMESPFLDPMEGYGGVVARTERRTRVFGVAGGDDVYNATLLHFPEEEVFVVSMSNHSESPDVEQLPAVLALVFGGAYEPPPPTISLDSESLAARAGRYTLPGGGRVEIRAGEHGLIATGRGPRALDLLAPGPHDEASAGRFMRKTLDILEAAAVGEMRPLAQEYKPRALRGKELEKARRVLFGGPGDSLGAYLGMIPMGTVDVGFALESVVELRFQKGIREVRFGWADGDLALVETLEAPLEWTFRPTSAREFLLHDSKTGQQSRIRFDGDTLVFLTHRREVTAEKEPR